MIRGGPFDIVEDFRDGRHVLAVNGELDMATAPQLEAAVEFTCSRGDAGGVLIDLGGLQFIDSTGMRSVQTAVRICTGHGREVAIAPGSPRIQSLFEITGLVAALPFLDGAGEYRPPEDAVLPKLFAVPESDTDQ